MRHRKRKKAFECRTVGHRKALMKNLLIALFRHQKINTTVGNAKAVKSAADKLITLGKESTIHARRQVFGVLQDRTLVKRLFSEIAPQFKKRSGGYTRVIRCPNRKGDGAEMAVLELTELISPVEVKTKPVKKISQPLKEEATPKAEKTEPKKKEEKPLGFLGGLRKRFRTEQ